MLHHIIFISFTSATIGCMTHYFWSLKKRRKI